MEGSFGWRIIVVVVVVAVVVGVACCRHLAEVAWVEERTRWV
jgi:hypothetical protein